MANFLKQYVVKIAQASSSSLEILTETSGSQFCTKPDAVSVSVFTKYFHLLFVREPQSSPAAAATVNQILKRPSWYKSGGKMSLAIVENNAKKTIKKLSLHKRRPRWARLDFIPFVVLYIIPIAIYFSIDATDESTRFSRLVALSCEGLLLLAHVMVFLMQQWSKAIKCFVGYSPVQAIHEATHVLAEPFEHCGCSAICSIAANKSPEDGKIQYSFRFQRLVYRYFDQHSTPSTKGLSTSIDTIAKTAGFTRLEYPTSNLLSTYHTTKGMSSSTYKLSQLYFGLNIIELPIPPFLELFADHLLAPFFVFQVFCVALWMLDEYWYYALFTLVMLLVFESTVCYTRVVSMKNLRGQARPSQQVYVYRDNKWSSHPVDSRELVPGDIISLSVSSSSTNTTDADDGNSTRSGKTIPCDALLLYGSAVVNEAMLTGESVPLLKEAMVVDGTESLRFTDGTDKQHQKNVVFSGTEILKLEDTTTSSSGTASDQQNITSSRRIPKPPDKGAVAYVLRTGFGTTQGELMRTILFATERVSVGDSETLLLLLIMLVFAIIASSYVLHEGLKDITASRWKLFLHCTMICTSVVPPELPMELSLAVTNSLNALRDRMIFCVEPFRIPYAGKVDICCFDKTGTLTSDQFRVNGVVAVKNGGGNSVEGSRKKENGSKENEEKESVSSNSSYSSSFEMIHDITKVDINVARVLGCCNSIIWLNGEMAGDPMEVATVKALEWSVRGNMAVPNDNSSLPIEIIKRYGFSSSLKRMSVIVKVGEEFLLMLCCSSLYN
jgi:cation-transporting ATPase 13A1